MKKRNLVILLVLLLLVGTGVYTYARYSTSISGNAAVEVAKWAVKVTNGTDELSESFDLALTLDANDYVADGKIAPGRSASGKVVLDLTGTEVDTDYTISLGEVTNIPTNAEVVVKVGTQELTLDGTGEATGTITHETIKTNPTVELTISVIWENNDLNNAEDTLDGVAAKTLTLPITVTAQQHIG